jgi:hypothetical protein
MISHTNFRSISTDKKCSQLAHVLAMEPQQHHLARRTLSGHTRRC